LDEQKLSEVKYEEEEEEEEDENFPEMMLVRFQNRRDNPLKRTVSQISSEGTKKVNRK